MFAAAYGVLTFLGHLGLLYGTPIVGQKICAREPTIDKDAREKRGSLVPPIPPPCEGAGRNCRPGSLREASDSAWLGSGGESVAQSVE